MSYREYLDMVVAELSDVGLRYEVARGGKHPFVRIELPDGSVAKHILPGSPSDVRGLENSRCDLRKTLANAGVLKSDAPDADIEPELVVLKGGFPAASSLMLAKRFSKQHKDVLRAIDNLLVDLPEEFNRRNFTPIAYQDARGRSQRAFEMSRDGFSIVAMGFTGREAALWKIRFLEAFNAMENELKLYAERDLISRICALEAANAKMAAEQSAMSDLMLEMGAAEKVAVQTIIRIKPPFVSVRAQARIEARRRARAA